MPRLTRFLGTTVLVGWLGLFPPATRGGTFQVTSTQDSGEGSLRAILESLGPGAGDEVIDLTTIAGVIELTAPLPEIRANVRLLGPTEGELRLDGQGQWPILAFASGTTGEVHRLVLTNALATGYRHGAAISNAGSLLLRSCRLVGNLDRYGWGGALYNRGQLTILDSTLTGNRAEGEPGESAGTGGPGGGGAGLGGAVFHDEGSLLASNCVFLSNAVSGGDGGPNTNDTFHPNPDVGRGRGGGPFGGRPGPDSRDGGFGSGGAAGGVGGFGGGAGGAWLAGARGGDALGGALFARTGTVDLVRCRFERNFARGGQGNFAALVGGAGGDALGGAGFQLGTELRVEQCEFRGNRSDGGAPGTYKDFVLGGNIDPAGTGEGGAWSVYGGKLRLRESIFDANSALGSEGGQGKVGFAGAPGRGGAVAVRRGDVQIRQSLFTTNLALGGKGRSPRDGGEAIGGAVACLGPGLEIENCSFAGNRAQGGDASEFFFQSGKPGTSAGGALGVRALGTNSLDVPVLELRFSTLSGNESVRASVLVFGGAFANPTGVASGGGLDNAGGVVRLGGVILAGNRAFTDADLNGAIESRWANLVQDPGTAQGLGPTDLLRVDPKLGPLADHGGTAATFSLEAGSPALDRLVGLEGPDTDQRGKPRPAGAAWDLGAFERETGSAVAPRFGLVRWDEATRRVVLSLADGVGSDCRVEASTDLSIWSPIGSLGIGAEFREPAEQSARFYRLVRDPE